MKKEFMLKNNYKEKNINDEEWNYLENLKKENFLLKEKMIEFYTPKGEEKMIS